MPRDAVFTIVSQNYLHFAKTLMNSLREHAPEFDRFVVICDVRDEAVCDSALYETIYFEDLSIDHSTLPVLRYGILELNTAIKPTAFRLLFEKMGYENVIYFDPDIRLYSGLGSLRNRLETADALLTPHLTRPMTDDSHPAEVDILRSGSFNLGFLALHASPNTSDLLDWWAAHLADDCVADPDRGLFVDQKWMDLVPGMFERVEIVRDSSWNVAYWNLPHRAVTESGDEYLVDGTPLLFFHFSGIEIRGDVFSKHQDRYTMRSLNETVRAIASSYRAELLRNGADEYSAIPYGLANFGNGTPIPDQARRVARSLHAEGRLALARGGDEDFIAYLNSPASLDGESIEPISILALQVWSERSDLRAAFPDLLEKHRFDYCHWFKDNVAEQSRIADVFIDPIRNFFERVPKANGQPLAGEVSANTQRGGSGFFRVLYKIAYRFRKAAALFVSPERRKIVKNQLLRRAHSTSSKATMLSRSALSPDRLRVVGYLHAESGVGESARCCLRSSLAAGIETAMHDFRTGNVSRMEATLPTGTTAFDGPSINVLHVNADQTSVANGALPEIFAPENYNIGFWHWETPDFPEEFDSSFEFLDEIWTSSSFCFEAISARSPVPVTLIPHSILLPEGSGMTRSDFGLREDSFLVLAMFDTMSISGRKNPQAAIAAFLRAKELGLQEAQLVVKIINEDHDVTVFEELGKLAERQADITLIQGYLHRDDVVSLYKATDAFLSLHRSEGFGLCLAEIMSLGKSVIATGWSGNMDFMNAQNSYPVRHTIQRNDAPLGSYPAGSTWAEPDIEHAARCILEAASKHQKAAAIKAAAKRDIQRDFAPRVVGNRIRKRLEEIVQEQKGRSHA
jgi:glycosyltransferase involved in cell wall biosynthesis